MEEQITSILNHLLKEYSKVDANEKHINLQLSINGYIQIDAVGCWIKDFSIDRFKSEKSLRPIVKIIVYTGNNQQINKYEIKSDLDCSNSIPPVKPNTSEYFVSFAFLIDKTKLDGIFVKMKVFFKDTALRFPSIKMSITGDLRLLQESKNICMIGEAISDVLKYSYYEKFREEILKSFGVENKQEVIDKVCKSLAHQLENID